MGNIDNGGAQAIKGFNYQKSVIALIAVLHYLDESQVDIYIEAEDDIVVKSGDIKTFIQAKSSKLSISSITKRKGGKDSTLEKNIAKGDETSIYKLVTPEFSDRERNLKDTDATIFAEEAQVFSYTDTAVEKIRTTLPSVSEQKLGQSRVVLTPFPANQHNALTHVKGVMSNCDISIDNSYGNASLGELCLRIDQKSEVVVKTAADYEKKKITQAELRQIFNHTRKAKCYEDIIDALGCSVMEREILISRHAELRALYSASLDEARQLIDDMDDVTEVDEQTIIDRVLNSLHLTVSTDAVDRKAIAISALSQVIFERSSAC